MFNSKGSLTSRINLSQKSENSARRRKELIDKIRERSEKEFNFIKRDIERYEEKVRGEEEARREKQMRNRVNPSEKAAKVK